jgi:hypothetical protein
VLTIEKGGTENNAVDTLLSAAAVRDRANQLFEVGLAGGLTNFRIDQAKLESGAQFVAKIIRQNYPDLKIPIHARWRHFFLDGRDLWAETAGRTEWPNASVKARATFDLAMVSVLLDGGAGSNWRYRDDSTGLTLGRSEGLALASLRMFEKGSFSGHSDDPLRADGAKLASLTVDDLAKGFKVTIDNPLPGIEGRVALLARLGRHVMTHADVFGMEDMPRPGGLFDRLAKDRVVTAPDLLKAILKWLGPIWPTRSTLSGVALGDTWRHNAVRRPDATDRLVPLHKLSQWLAYSLIEPLNDAGIAVTELEGLTGLAEYRNGGLFIDTGVLVPREQSLMHTSLPVDSEPVVEWRALTVALLDRIAPLIRKNLGVSPSAMPLGSVLEGGTWAAGRTAAKLKRADGSPPLTVISDGTVF